MNRAIPIIGTLLAILVLLVVQPVLADETITADEFAARCAAAQGNLTLNDDLRVEGGAAEVGACTVNLGSFRLEIREAELSFTGNFVVLGERGSEIRIDQSTLFQSDDGVVSITLRAHRIRIQETLLDFSGNVHLVADSGDRGEVRVEASDIWSLSGDIRIAASRNASGGKVEVKGSSLFAARHLSLLVGDQRNGRRGEIKVEDSAVVGRDSIRILTGQDGKTEVRRNNRALEMDEVSTGISTHGTLTIASGNNGETEVRENRIVAQGGVRISSGGRTRVRENDFTGSGPVVIQGPRCEARDNTPSVNCTR